MYIDIILVCVSNHDLTDNLSEAYIQWELHSGLHRTDEDQESRMQVQVNRLSAGMRNDTDEQDKSRLMSRHLANFVYLARANEEQANSLYDRVMACIDHYKI